jgi:hypothetical protein
MLAARYLNITKNGLFTSHEKFQIIQPYHEIVALHDGEWLNLKRNKIK